MVRKRLEQGSRNKNSSERMKWSDRQKFKRENLNKKDIGSEAAQRLRKAYVKGDRNQLKLERQKYRKEHGNQGDKSRTAVVERTIFQKFRDFIEHPYRVDRRLGKIETRHEGRVKDREDSFLRAVRRQIAKQQMLEAKRREAEARSEMQNEKGKNEDENGRREEVERRAQAFLEEIDSMTGSRETDQQEA